MAEYNLICKNCKSTFNASRKKRMYCSTKCVHEYLRNNGKEIYKKFQTRPIKNCEICGKEFKANPNRDNARYCSRGCLGKANGIRATKELVKIPCLNCGDAIFKKPGRVKEDRMNFCGYDCMGEYYVEHKLFSGENNGAWAGGSVDYYGDNWRSQRKKARKRDNYTCKRCGITEEEYGMRLSVHHKKLFRDFDDYKEANKLSNLVSLCEPCHRKVHSEMNKAKKKLDG